MVVVAVVFSTIFLPVAKASFLEIFCTDGSPLLFSNRRLFLFDASDSSSSSESAELLLEYAMIASVDAFVGCKLCFGLLVNPVGESTQLFFDLNSLKNFFSAEGVDGLEFEFDAVDGTGAEFVLADNFGGLARFGGKDSLPESLSLELSLLSIVPSVVVAALSFLWRCGIPENLLNRKNEP